MSTIDGSDSNPFPPPPEGWRPEGLVQVERNAAENALWDRVQRVAKAYRLSTRDAVEHVACELRTPVTGSEAL